MSIAIVGLSCRLPAGLNHPDRFWEALLEGVDAVSEVPPSRWDAASFHDPERPRPGAIRNRAGAFLDDVDGFDASFFGMFPAQARSVDPQQRLLLELAVEAIEDAGVPIEVLRGTPTAAFVGSFMYDHMNQQLSPEQRDRIGPYVAMGAGMTSLANRISYTLDLRGPSVSLDTACSSSLSAVHLACRALMAGDATAALAGGVNVILRPEGSIMLSAAGFLGPGGRCRAFDADADGYVRGEGAVLFLLEPLERALAAGRRIHAVIRGTAMSQDGHVAAGFTVPKEEAQVSALRAAYAQAGVDPATVDYVEAHGPGTKVGDPIECRALGSVLGEGRDAPCLVGSVKTNVGHLEGAAGAVGLLKAVLVAREARVPPNLHFRTPNPDIPFDELRLRVVDEVVELPSDRPRRVGVNSFGAGGTNVHVVLESAGGEPARQEQLEGPRPFAVSGADPAALAEQARAYAAATALPLTDLSWTLARARSQHPERIVLSACDEDELKTGLEAVASGRLPKGAERVPLLDPDAPRGVGLLFSGQGGQWPRMGVALMAREPVFREAMHEIDALFAARAGWSLLEEIGREPDQTRIHETEIVQPSIMAVQVALGRVLQDRGVRVDAVAGHSIGEVAAAWFAGALTLEEAVEVVHGRSVIQARAAGGTLLATGLTQDEVLAELRRHPELDLAAVNGPAMTVVAGAREPLAVLQGQLEARGVFARWVNVEVAYHSRWMAPLEAALNERLGHIHGRRAELALFSTVTGARETGTHLGGDYWYRNVREAVLLHPVVGAMVDEGVTTFLEVGPHPVLAKGAARTIEARQAPGLVLRTLDRGVPDATCLTVALGALAVRGHQVDEERLWGPAPRAVPLPAYPWQRVPYRDDAARPQRRVHPWLRGRRGLVTSSHTQVFEAHVSLDASPWLDDHRVDGAAVLPGTAHLDLALAAAREAFGHDRVQISDVRFEQALVVPERTEPPLEVRLEIRSAEGDFALVSRSSGDVDAPWATHSRGRIHASEPQAPAEPLDAVRARFEGASGPAAAAFYRAIEVAGLRYGPAFQGVTELWVRPGEVLARLSLPETVGHDAVPHVLHPALLDAALHTVFGEVHAAGDADRIYLPHALGALRVSGAGVREGWAHVRVHEDSPTWLVSDTTLYAEDGHPVARMDGLRCKHLPTRASADAPHHCLEVSWRPAPRSEGVRHPSSATRRVVVGDGPVADALQRRLRAARISPSALGDLDRRTQVVLVPGGDPWPVLQVGKRLAETGAVPDVFVITHGPTPEADAVAGAARVLGNELPRVAIRVVGLGEAPGDVELAAVVEELDSWRADLHEAEIRVAGGTRERRVVSPASDEALREAHTELLPARGGAWEAEVRTPGVLDSIAFVREPVLPLQPDELRIEVRAAALNFKDVMNGMGLLSEEAVAGGLSGSELGLEVSGVVAEVGADIADFRPGDRVVARVRRGFAGQVTARRCHVAPLPDGIEFEAGAAIPAAGLTAWYGLVHLARVEPGETVLVHSATGGVGRAAVALAHSLGARVIGTAGSAERRALLRSWGVEHVFDSRSVGFRQGVLDATEGRGADVVLNSLTGALLRESLASLAPFGRFVEIGKSDIYGNAPVGLRQLGENASLFVVDVDRLAVARPALHQRGLEEVVRLYGAGTLPAPETTVLPVARLAEALQTMARSGHTGKLVVEMTGEVPALPMARPRLRGGSYLVTGGASGLGLVLAGWLASRGADHLVLASRSGPRSDADVAAIEQLRASGVSVSLETLDVTDPKAVRALVERVPLAGVVHCAAVLDDRSLSEIDEASFARVWAPKACGAHNLHRACLDQDLELFVMVSSISSVLGLVGQGAYASANAFLDGLAAARREAGLAGASVNLGVLGDYAGMSRRTDDNAAVLDVLESHGLQPVRLQPLLASLDGVLAQGAVQRAIVRLDWRRFVRAHPHLERDDRYLELAASASEARASAGTHRATLAAMAADDRPEHLTALLAGALGGMLGVDGSALDPRTPLDVLGLDSLVLTQLRSWMLRELDVAVPMLKLLSGPSLAELALDLGDRLASSDGDGSEAHDGGGTESVLNEPWAHALDPWLIESAQSDAGAPVTVVCFHSMGVGASLFAPFLQRPPQGLRVLAVQTPGREERGAEPPVSEVLQVVDAAVERIRAHVDGPVILWGHSFGGIVAYEVARRLLDDGGPPVAHLMVTGTVAPHLVELWQRREVMLRVSVADNSAEYLMALSRHVEDPTFVRAILPLMRRDTPLLMRYTPAERPPLPVPITAFAARQDDMVYPDEIAPWREHTSAGFHLEAVDGDHWFLSRNRQAIVAALEALGLSVSKSAAA